MKQSPKRNRKIIDRKTISISKLLDSILNKYSFAVAFCIVIVLLLVLFKNFILGKFYYLFNDIAQDSILVNFPRLLHGLRYLNSEGFPLWSFSQGMGQNIMAFCLSDPFYWIVYLFGVSNAAYSIIWMEITKFLLTAVLFYHFLKLWNLSNLSTIIGTMLYCFSGFMFVGSQWWVFSTEACFLALLLLGSEKLYRQNSWYLFPLAVALLAMFNPFSLYTSCLFLIIYFSFHHFSSEKHRRKLFFSTLLKMCWLGVIGLMISSLFLVANIQSMIESPRGSGHFSYFHLLSSIPIFSFENPDHYVTAILRFFSNDLMGNGKNYSGWHNYLEAPLFYIGLLPLLLLPQAFFLFKERKLIIYISFLVLFLIPVIFPYFRYALFLFTGDYYRIYALFTSLTLLFIGLDALEEIQKKSTINLYVLLGTLLVLITILLFPYETKVININIAGGAVYPSSQNTGGIISINSGLRFILSIFLLSYTLILFLFKFIHYRTLAQCLLIIIVIIELGYMNINSLNDRGVISKLNMISYCNYSSKDEVDYVNSIDKGFFRMIKLPTPDDDERYLLNEAMIQGYYGTLSYSSFNQKYYIRFMEEMGIIKRGDEAASRFCYGLISRPLLWSFASVKYYIGNCYSNIVKQFGFKPIRNIGPLVVYKNSNFLPLGFTYHEYIPMSKFRYFPDNIKEIVIQKAIVLEDPILPCITSKLKEFDLNNLSQYNENQFYSDIANLNKNAFNMTYFSQNYIDGTISLDMPKILFFSIPYDKGWNVVIDNKVLKPQLCNIGFLGVFLESGYHNIKLIFIPTHFFVSLFTSILGLIVYFGLIAFQFYRNTLTQKIY